MSEKGRRYHVRCPACGKLSVPIKFQQGAVGEHKLESATMLSVPRAVKTNRSNGMIEWVMKPLVKGELRLMLKIFRNVVSRLEEVLTEE